MAWIESHQTLLTHRKTGRLARALDISKITAIGHLHAFWWWCLDNAPDGNLTDIDAADIADGACWEGDPDAFLAALIHAGFVDSPAATPPQVHEWMDYAGKLIEQRKAHAERMRNARRAPKPTAPPPSPARNGHEPIGDISREDHVTSTFTAREAIPYSTVQNTTEQDESTDRAPTREAQQRAAFDAAFSHAHPDPPGAPIPRPARPAFKPSDNPAVRTFVDSELAPIYPHRDNKHRSPQKTYLAVAGITPDRWPDLVRGAGYYAASIDAADGVTKDLHNWINDGDWEEWAKGPAAPRPQKGSSHDRPLYPTADERRSESFAAWGRIARGSQPASDDDPGEPGAHLRLIGPGPAQPAAGTGTRGGPAQWVGDRTG